MQQHCWGSVVDVCSGDISREHVISRCLSDKQVQIRGLKWCRTELKTIGVDSLTSHCLCRGHNNRLSPLDNEAKRAQEAISWFASALSSPNNRIADGRHIHGPRFAKWCAKTVCNLHATEGKQVPSRFARYAFARGDDASIRFYAIFPFRQDFEIDVSHLGLRWLHREDQPDELAVLFMFYGLWVVLSSINLAGTEKELMAGFGLPGNDSIVLVDRMQWMYAGTGHRLRMHEVQRTLRFLWGEDVLCVR